MLRELRHLLINYVIFFIQLLIISYLAVIGLIFFFQRKLMYHPSHDIGEPEKYGLNQVEEIFIKASDGISLQIWQRAAKAGYPTIIYFHGNAIHLADRVA